jgi:hypothetical protein
VCGGVHDVAQHELAAVAAEHVRVRAAGAAQRVRATWRTRAAVCLNEEGGSAPEEEVGGVEG